MRKKLPRQSKTRRQEERGRLPSGRKLNARLKLNGPPEAATVDPSEVEPLVALKHPEPHRILGPHLSDDGVIIRAFRPERESG